jgi:hypothetical protein
MNQYHPLRYRIHHKSHQNLPCLTLNEKKEILSTMCVLCVYEYIYIHELTCFFLCFNFNNKNINFKRMNIE